MNAFKKYLKEKKISIDNFCIEKAEMFEGLFEGNSSKTNLLKKKILPYGWHWLYFTEIFPFDKMGPDGHEKRGSFLPPFKGCKRMFAGSEIKFKKKITFNDKVKKISQIQKIENKSRENKAIYFVTINHLYKIKNELVLEENQNLVFVNKNFKSKRKILFKKEKEFFFLYKKKFSFDNVSLFRYSAITYNAHRIHYDIQYTKKEEGYENLLVHGPLLAKYALVEFMINIKYKVKTFEFKMFKPILVNEKVNLKIFQNKENKNEFKFFITDLKSTEVKFLALCTCKLN